MIVRTAPEADGRTALWLWCPGCEDLHRIVVGSPGASWTWDGDRERPTISPSILVRAPGRQRVCHSFVVAGQWQFLADSTHSLAGLAVPCVPIPGDYFESES